MSKNMKTVSVAMATYNGQHYIREQLDSILEQTITPDEIVIVDDCSSDATMDILNGYESEHPGIIKVFQNESNLGYIKNFEKAISLCSSQYIALSDQDDIWMRNKLEVLLQRIGDSLLIHSDAHIIDADGSILQESYSKSAKKRPLPDYLDIIHFNSITGCTTLIKKELFALTAPFPVTMPHDWWLAMVAVVKDSIEYSPDPLIMYRQHDNNAIGCKFAKDSIGRRIHSDIRTMYQSIYKRNKRIRTIKNNLDLLVSRGIHFDKEIAAFHKNIATLDYYYSSGEHVFSITAWWIWIRNFGKLARTNNDGGYIHIIQSLLPFLCYDWYTRFRTKKSSSTQG